MLKIYKHKIVRDLAWCITSENLLNHPLCVQKEFFEFDLNTFQDHLNSLDKDPSPLVDFLASKNTHRLGHYFEALVYYWLTISERFEILISNYPLRNTKGITKGEVDLIVQDTRTTKIEHWELAVKFYLAFPDKEETLFIGPNANDYLHLKLTKLVAHQCEILKTEEGVQLLTDLNIKDVEARLFVKGALYYHPKKKYSVSPTINPTHNKGWWIYYNEAQEFLKEDCEFLLLHKKDWLSSVSQKENLLSKSDCLELVETELKDSPRSLYIACFKNGELQSTGFVVHDNWPKI
jgi:hypothetical protein